MTAPLARRALALAAFALVASCLATRPTPFSPPPALESRTAPGPAEKGATLAYLDRHVSPCQDFYAFATGAWRAQHPIPVGKSKWGPRSEAHEANRERVHALLDEVSARKDWPEGSTEQLVGDYYASCMDSAAVEAAGLAPLAPLLAEIDAATTPKDVARLVRRLHDLGIAAPLGVVGAFVNREPTRFVANVVAGSLGLGDRDRYADDALRERYRAHVAAVLRLGEMPEARARAGALAVVALERRLADASLDPKTALDPVATEHELTFAQLEELAPRLEWGAYFDEGKIPRGAVNVAEPKLVQQVDRELVATPVATWKTYLRFQLLDAASPWLARAFVDESFAFKEGALAGATTERRPRAAWCAETTEALLPEPLGKAYAARYFPPAARTKARAIAGALRTTLREAVSAAPWLGDEARRTALEKVDTMRIELGYPDAWKETGGLGIRPGQLWANVARARRRAVDEGRAAMGKPTDRRGWLLSPASADAYIDLQLNELVLPAGFLQAPLFDVNASDAVNFGAFGAGLVHDMTHAVDATGAELDAVGRAKRWWSVSDEAEFRRRAACVVTEYDGYFVEPGLHHDGKQVLNEALGEISGVALALRALERSMETRPLPTIEGFTPEQQFFLAWGQLRGEAMSLEAQRSLVKGDPHPTPQFRVIGAVANAPAFQRAFGCSDGDAMVRAPADRCGVW